MDDFNKNTISEEIPKEIKKWNWGAFQFSAFWGIGNKTYLPLLALIPIFNFIWMFVCGFKGNQWAWKKYEDKDLNTFLKVQETWNRAGFWGFIISILSFILIFIFQLFITFTTLNSI